MTEQMTMTISPNQTGTKKSRVAVAGATGYVGQELCKILSGHDAVEIVDIASTSESGKEYADLFPAFKGAIDKTLSPFDIKELAANSDILFLALPHGVAAGLLDMSVLGKTRVIDLSGDFRLSDMESAKANYGEAAATNELFGMSVYGLCELNANKIANASLVANPGCYATAAILALAPLVKDALIETDSIILDGKSGVSGAGRQALLKLHFNEVNESVKAYATPTHRHSPEIEETLSKLSDAQEEIVTTFTAHLVPMSRGILMTAYAKLASGVDALEIAGAYESQYGSAPFVEVLGEGGMPETRFVRGSNNCQIGYAIDRRSSRIVVVSAIDNLVKGASGQAVQNMNIMLGLDETTGLKQIPAFL